MPSDLNRDLSSARLVVSDDALTDQNALYRQFHQIKVVNDYFGMGIKHPSPRAHEEIATTAYTLRQPNGHVGGTNDLLYIAIARQLPPETRALIKEEGMHDDRRYLEVWRELGFAEFAAIHDAWWDLANEVEIEVVSEKHGTWADIANHDDINEKSSKLLKQIEPLLPSVTFSQDEINTMVCDKFHLDMRPLEAFNQYWVSRIIEAAGFARFQPEEDVESWSLDNELFGWLTVRHGAALAKHGYRYKFSFWKQEIGYSRGHLWIQTDRGPLRLTDHTDAVSMRSYFPVQVSNISGDPLFELHEEDVPDELMRRGPNIPPELSATKPTVNWNAFWKRFLGSN